MKEETPNEGKKRRPRLGLEFSGGGILVLGGVIVATAWAARRGHVNRERNKRRTTQGQGGEAGGEEYQKEKELEEVKDGSKDERFEEISAVDEGLVEMKEVGSIPLIKEQTQACYFDDGGTELCVFQSDHTEKREEEEKSIEKIEMVVDHVEQVEGKDGIQEVGEDKTSACNEEDGCHEVGEGPQISKKIEMAVVHVEQVEGKDGSQQEVGDKTSACNEEDGGCDEVGEGPQIFVDQEQEEGKDGSQEVGEDKASACNEEDGGDEVGEWTQISKNDDVQKDQIYDDMLFGHAFNKVPIHVEDDTKDVHIINAEDDTKEVVIHGEDELCVHQSLTEKREEEERSVEKIEMVVDHVEQVEGKDDTKHVDIINAEEDTKEVVIHGEDELCVYQSLTELREEEERSVEKIEMVVDHVEHVEGKDGSQEVGEDKVSGCNEEDGCDEGGEWTQVSKNEDVQEDQICDEMLVGHAFNQSFIHVEDDTKHVDIHGEDDTKQVEMQGHEDDTKEVEIHGEDDTKQVHKEKEEEEEKMELFAKR
ncbi:hypothetical protein J5N97_018259 [Dioscorea zingiberensis]|uniref:Uncharacterized protein n=1 Tax=Dioscorea zingiberensis TaxID=325984 RepID=A0A9D5HH54_9LILI|nr:hypothetical protein J5N97_018259 [Dioscorea zingiberensis]